MCGLCEARLKKCKRRGLGPAWSIVQSHGGLGKSWKCHFWECIPALSIVLSRGGLGSRRSNYLKCFPGRLATLYLSQKQNRHCHMTYRCVQKKGLSAHFLDPEKAEALYGQIGKVLNPDWGQRGRFSNIDGHELDNLITKWLEKDSIHTDSARRIQIWAPKNHLDGCLSKSRKPRKISGQT